MTKIMLVEDDNNLREIYEARLSAEGYEIISAQDGEEALAMAVKERPDLIISDIMMPKISGFDMLDILRSTPETRDTKVIMMTALSQAEDKARAAQMGADRYLVKSQVTLEDVAKVVREVLEQDAHEQPQPAAPDPAGPPAQPPAQDPQVPPDDPQDPTPAPPAPPTPTIPTATPPNDSSTAATLTQPAPASAQTTAAETATIESQIEEFINTVKEAPPLATPPQVATDSLLSAPPENPAPPATDTTPPPATDPPLGPVTPVPSPVTPTNIPVVIAPSSPQTSEATQTQPAAQGPLQPAHQKVIQPINDLSDKSAHLDALLAQEESRTQVIQSAQVNGVATPQIIPGNAPQPPEATPGTTFDPNSIAL